MGDKLLIRKGNYTLRSSIADHSITWTFNTTYKTGQYFNGDYWVLDEGSGVTVSSVSPAPTGSGSSYRNGSMKNPCAGQTQGFDGRIGTPANSVTFPVVLYGGESLISTESRPENDDPRTDVRITAGATPLTDCKPLRASVLSCVSAFPGDSDFRPTIYGTSKINGLSTSSINWSLLPDLDPPTPLGSIHNTIPDGYTACSYLTHIIERPQISFFASWMLGRQCSPTENSIDYHRDYTQMESVAALLLCCDPSAAGLNDQTNWEALVKAYIQLGIDCHGCAASAPSAATQADAKLNEFAGVIAGHLLGNSTLKNRTYGSDYWRFKSRVNIIAGTCWTGADVVYIGLYGEPPSHETVNPFSPEDAWCAETSEGTYFHSEAYRRQNHGHIWVGSALAIRALGLSSYLGNSDWLKYCDRQMLYGTYSGDEANYDDLSALFASQTCEATYHAPGQEQGTSMSGFVDSMWSTYRGSY